MKILEFIGITLITILLCLCVCIGCDNIAKQKGAIEVNDANKIITVSTAGTMKSLLGNDYLNITSLKIVGPINGDDIYYLCKMLGASSFSQADWGKLTTLDLSEASIVEGGNWYYCDNSSNNYYTSNNVIGDFMFNGCANLQKIVLPVSVTSIGTSAFSGCSSLTSIDFPKSVTFIGGIAFMGCSSLKSLVIPTGTSIGECAFWNCSSLEDVYITGVDSIKNGTFYGCSSLRVVVIVGVTSIGVSAFEGCSSLVAFHCYNKTPPTIESYKRPSFPKYGKETTLYVPERCGIKYNSSDWGYYFENIIEIE